MKCRIDKKSCKVFLNFGKMPIANGFLRKDFKKKEYFFNLEVAFNERLSLFQLSRNPSPQKMFNKHYPFYTSSSKNMIKHFKNTAKWIKKKYLKKKSNVLEIGSNDGTFLKNFKKEFSLGFEPSKSVHLIAKKRKVNSFNFFFNKKNLKLLNIKHKFYDLVYGANVFCHIPNQVDLIKTIDKVLSKNGTIIFEEPYLGSMYKKISYDQIYDEHIYMFSIASIEKIYKLFGFTLIDAAPLKTHGGSMRYILKRGNVLKKSKRLKNLINIEKKYKVNSFKGCLMFKRKVELSKNKLLKKNQTYYLKKRENLWIWSDVKKYNYFELLQY